jgi:predicted ArsR family transcriptional regulator
MGRPAVYDWEQLQDDTFDLLDERPQGATLIEIADRLGVPEHVARQTINKLREFFAEDGQSDVSVITKNNGRERLYALTDATANSETEEWMHVNQKYVRTRLNTVHNVFAALERKAQSENDQDKIRRLRKTLDRLIEDLDDLAL